MTWFFDEIVSLTAPGCAEEVSNPSFFQQKLHFFKNLFSFKIAIAFMISKIDSNNVRSMECG